MISTSIKSSLLPRPDCFESSLLPRPNCFESSLLPRPDCFESSLLPRPDCTTIIIILIYLIDHVNMPHSKGINNILTGVLYPFVIVVSTVVFVISDYFCTILP